MLRINLIVVGKIKESFFKAGIAEYLKRLQAFCKVNIIEVSEAKFKGVPNKEQIHKIIESEASEIYDHIKIDDFVIALMLDGKELDSVQFAKKIADISLTHSTIDFVIGGSNGLPKDFKCDLSLSFGKITFPHQLFRLVLCEQIYRAFMINNDRNYHK